MHRVVTFSCLTSVLVIASVAAQQGAPATDCDLLAAHPADPERVTRAALLVDASRLSADVATGLFARLAERSTVSMCRAYADWNVSMGVQWDPGDTRSEKGDLHVQYKPEANRVANLGYRFYAHHLHTHYNCDWPLVATPQELAR